MRVFTALRISAHACLYLAVACLTELYLSAWYAPFAFALLFITAAFCAAQLESTAARIAVSLVPAAALLLCPGYLAAAVLLPPVVYLVLVMAVGRFGTEIWRFRRGFALIIFSLVLILGLSVMFGYTTLVEEIYPKAPLYSCWVFLFSAFTLALIALRAVRVGAVRSAAWQAGNAAFVLIPFALAAAFGVFFLYGLVPVLKYIGIAAAAPIFLIIYGGYQLFAWIMSQASIAVEEPMTAPPTVSPEVDDGVVNPHRVEAADFFKRVKYEIPDYVFIIGAIVVIALLIFLLVRAVTKGGSKQKGHRFDGLRDYAADPADKREKRRKLSADGKADGAERVRYTYRQYLSFLRIHGIIPGRSRTSGEISEEARTVLKETDELLRALYRKARYGKAGVVTDEEAKLAEEAYLALVNDDNIIKKS